MPSHSDVERDAAQLAALIESMPQAVYFGDAQGITRCNARAMEMLGITSQEELQHPIGDLATKFNIRHRTTREPVAIHDLPFSRALRGEQASLDTWATHGATGREVCIRGTASPVYLGGRLIGAVAVNTDITEQVEIEESLREARDAAQAANRAKDRFLAVLSHELRTPLSPVLLTVSALEKDPLLPPRLREDIAMIRRNIDLETKLIDDLLDLSRVVSGKLRLDMQRTHVHELLEHVLSNCADDLQNSGLKLETDFGAREDAVTADSARLQLVFWNVLRNAIKFTPRGGTISLRTSNDAANRIKIEFIDSGVGISADLLPRIFDAFEQGDPRAARQFGGLGLGLSISKAVIEMHNGTIQAQSAGANQGAIFLIELPTRPAVAPAPLKDDPAASSTAHVLLVEDHIDTARMLARLLGIAGYRVKTAHTVASALALADAEKFDVVVSDIGLPDATGYELMAQLRDRHAIKGIALTGFGMEDDMRKSQEAGFVDHVVKPVDSTKLDTILRRVLAE